MGAVFKVFIANLKVLVPKLGDPQMAGAKSPRASLLCHLLETHNNIASFGMALLQFHCTSQNGADDCTCKIPRGSPIVPFWL